MDSDSDSQPELLDFLLCSIDDWESIFERDELELFSALAERFVLEFVLALFDDALGKIFFDMIGPPFYYNLSLNYKCFQSQEFEKCYVAKVAGIGITVELRGLLY